MYVRLLSLLVLIVGCMGQPTAKPTSGNPGNVVNTPPEEYVRATTASVLSYHLLLPRLRSATGVNYNNDATLLAVADNFRAAMSANGHLTDYSSQLSLGVMELVATFCGKAIVRESSAGAQKLVFTGVDLNQPTASGYPNRQQFISALSQRFLGRNPLPDEVNESVDAIDQMIASLPAAGSATVPGRNNALGTRIVAQATCAAWGSSVEAVMQ